MNTTIYTFRNKKVVLISEPRFYILKSWQEFSDLVDKFLKVDMVATPVDIQKDSKFPLYLELQPGFGVNFRHVSLNRIKEDLKKERERLKELEFSLKA